MLYFNLISLFLIICCAVILGLQTPDIAASARVYPLVLIVLVIACSLAVAVKEIIGRATTAPLNAEFTRILAAPSSLRLRLLAFTVTWLIYPLVLSGTGFIASTTCALTLSLWLLKIKKPIVGAVSALVFSLTFSILFATALYIPTPSGPVDDLLTQLLYAIRH
jgi:hypothetical protein